MLWWPLHVTWLSRALALTPGISPAEETRYKGTHFVCVEGPLGNKPSLPRCAERFSSWSREVGHAASLRGQR